MVYFIPAHAGDGFQAKRAALIDRQGASALDTFVQVPKFTQTESFATGKTMMDLQAHIAMHGRRVHDYGRITQ
jgi:GTPase involved in cell partitioning and DNA repair